MTQIIGFWPEIINIVGENDINALITAIVYRADVVNKQC